MSASGDEAALRRAIERHAVLAIAVSGGVDSMTLAQFVHARTSTRAIMVHAVSPAVPVAAGARVRAIGRRLGWELHLTDAGELADPRYQANPVNRCYFCKSSLYDRIRVLTAAPIASGANLDDLDDYRPGLLAAKERGVVHPFIEAGFAKPAVRALARALGLDDLAELPAQPCLASRIETAIPVQAPDLAFIDRVEQAATGLAGPAATVRCRLTHAGVVLELDGAADAVEAALAQCVGALCREAGRHFLGIQPYRRGSAFVRAGQ
jgi:uncharacterized protein